MKRAVTLLPFMLLLFILPFRGTVALRLVCLAGALLVVILLWRRLAPPRVPCKPALIAWIAIALVSLIGAFDPAYSLGEIKNEIVYTMITFVAFFAITKEENDLEQLSIALVAGALVLCIWALGSRLELGAWQERGTGYGGSGAFPGYAAAVVPVLFLLGAYTSKGWRRAVVWTLFALLAVAAFFSLQRIVWPVAALDALIALILLERGGFIKMSRQRLVAGSVGIVLLAGGIFVTVNQERFQGSDYGVISKDSRLPVWSAVAGRIAEKPFMGSGFGRGVMRKADRDLIPKDNSMLWHAHNIFLNYGLQMGVPGMLALAWLILALLREYWRFSNAPDERLKLLGVAGIMLVAGVMLRNQASDEFLRDASILFWALNGALLGLGHRKLARTQSAGAA